MVDDEADFSILAGKDLSFSDISRNRDYGLDNLIQSILHRSCKAVRHLATPGDPDLRTVVGNIAGDITADLEARLLMAAPFKGHTYNTRSKLGASNPRDTVPANEHLDAYARDILKWAKKQSAMYLGADSIAPLFGSFMLFAAHHIKEHFRRHGEAGLFKPEDCRLILPVAKKGMRVERTDIDSADSDSSTDFYTPGYVDPTDFFSVECSMCPVFSSVEKQAVPAPHLVFADTEIVGHPEYYEKAELRLATKTKALFFNQHNRRFAWGLAVSNCTIHAYVFGPDDIWASTAMDISGDKGRRAFISLLVDWSLCSIDHLGFDPSIRYVVDRCVGGPYLEIDVHEMDESTGKVEPRTYYSQRCLGATDRLFRCHARYFATSTSPESMDKPAFLIKDVWMTTGSGSADDLHERLFLNVLHVEFDKSSEFSGSFVQLVSAGPVYINQGNTVVADSTDTAFAGLPSMTRDVAKDSDNVQGLSNSCVHQHRRTVTKWTGKAISEADNQSQVVVAVADAMTALNAAYVKCQILHSSISDRAILLQQTVDGIRGILTEFDYACYAGDSSGVDKVPELMLFQSIRSLEDPKAARTILDDLESLLYLVCWLGTFGVNKDQREAYIAGLPKNPYLPIMDWNRGTAIEIAGRKRSRLVTLAAFDSNILFYMRENSPLRPLAEDMYMALFLHPGCYGVTLLTDNSIARIEDGNIRAALHAVPVINRTRDPLALRHAFLAAIIAKLLEVLARHRDAALAALNAGGAEDDSAMVTLPSADPSMKHYRDEVPQAGPSKRPHF
ncbi:hypothetical protein GGI09_003546 [Coemansia sp. S100]|nr:hypothetical protein LPJ71_000820 [Coemansia sp. S17]KAJ2097983.1 hypothetical protein GGI09_003546 [Coemansia sp. S100]KAJ2103210.1 hypothetical protein GGI16_003033 [Coemansia sp. S142-1]